MFSFENRIASFLCVLIAFTSAQLYAQEQKTERTQMMDTPICLTNQDGKHLEQSELPYLHLTTDQGSIVIRLYANAAPKTFKAFVDLMEIGAGPATDTAYASDYYAGLEFDHVLADIEIRTNARSNGKVFNVPKEINAESLGLDKDIIETSAQAMDVFQFEIAKYYSNHKGSNAATPQVTEWMNEWYKNYDANFLMGVSRKTINEALGYTYVKNVQSHPVVRGSVMLKPSSAKSSGPELAIALTELPQRNGRWLVVGQVARGLEVADSISQLPVHDTKEKQYRPLKPVVISKSEIICESVRGGSQ